MEAENDVKVIKASEMNVMKILEPALRLGKPVIIEVCMLIYIHDLLSYIT